jgi:hypothetical protein
MTDRWVLDSTRRSKAALIDTRVANPARVADALSGGRNNFEVDRRASRMLTRMSPVIGTVVPAVRAYHKRVVRSLVEKAGIRQFLDTSIRLTMDGNTHEVAQSLAPECRIVYVSSDPMVLSHARSLATSTPEGAVAAVEADIGDPGAILTRAARTLDLGEPIAILLMGALVFVPDDAAAAGIVRSLAGGVPAGSHVVFCHHASDLAPEAVAAAQRWNAVSDVALTLRSRGQIAGLLEGLDAVPPGLVAVNEWRPAPDDPCWERPVPVYGAVARKPLDHRGAVPR